MGNITSTDNLEVSLDAIAAEELAKFIAGSDRADDADEIGLRLSVIGGGCAGFQYRLLLDMPKEDDMVFETHGQKVFVDPVSMNFVIGSTITYRRELTEAGFDVVNPNAQSACGCGSSFAMVD